MATKKQPAKPAGRPYTGATDPATASRPGTVRFVQYMTYLFQAKNLGIYANRPTRNGAGLSVHATGRACDLGGGPNQLTAMLQFLSTNANTLQLEEIHDYGNRLIPGKHGAGWRCDRDAWKAYDKPTIGSPGALWVHVELAPHVANDPTLIDQAFKAVFP